MILKMFLGALFFVIKSILSALPEFPRPSVNLDFTWLMQLVRILNQFIDLKVVGSLMIVWLLVELSLFSWSIINWIIHKIPGVS